MDKLFLGEVEVLEVVVDGVSRLDGADGGESPARPAGSLVLGGRNVTLSSPVNRFGESDVISLHVFSLLGSGCSLGDLGTQVDGLEFLAGEVGEFVNAELDGFVGVFSDEFKVFLENSDSVGLFFKGIVHLVVSSLEVHPLV